MNEDSGYVINNRNLTCAFGKVKRIKFHDENQ